VLVPLNFTPLSVALHDEKLSFLPLLIGSACVYPLQAFTPTRDCAILLIDASEPMFGAFDAATGGGGAAGSSATYFSRCLEV
jgi:hypothetical protein